MTRNFKQSRLDTFGAVDLWCEQCGHKIKGDPYDTSFSGWCCVFEPVHFCSKECWDREDNMYDSEKWPDPPKAPEGW